MELLTFLILNAYEANLLLPPLQGNNANLISSSSSLKLFVNAVQFCINFLNMYKIFCFVFLNTVSLINCDNSTTDLRSLVNSFNYFTHLNLKFLGEDYSNKLLFPNDLSAVFKTINLLENKICSNNLLTLYEEILNGQEWALKCKLLYILKKLHLCKKLRQFVQ